MDRRILSIWFPRLGLDRCLRNRRDEREAAPCAIVRSKGNLRQISLAGDRALGAGVRPGMKLADARAVCPALRVFAEDEAADLAFLRKLARWCVRFTPLVALDPPQGLFLDVTGSTHLFGGEGGLQSEMAARLAQLGITARSAIAPVPGAAFALARYGNGTAPPGDRGALRAALAPLPVAALRLEPEALASLMRLGFDHIGALYPLAGSALARRFGLHTLKRLNQVLGHEREPLEFIDFRPPFTVRLAFPEPVLHRPAIDRALEDLLLKLCGRLRRAGRGARRVELIIERNDHTTQRLAIGTARPVCAADYLFRLFLQHLEKIEPRFGIDFMGLKAPDTELLSDRERAFLSTGTKPETAEPDGHRLAVLIDVLTNRLGAGRVFSGVPVSTHIPERAWRRRPVFPANKPAAFQALRTGRRPLRLNRRPVPLREFSKAGFLWQGRFHAIARATGPERIEPEWWRDDPSWSGAARDYWWLELADGRELWAFRRFEALQPHWYLHGFNG